MRSSPFERLWRPNSLRSMAIGIAIVFASNMIGCHGGRRTSMRPRFLTSTTRSQAVVVDQGYTTVETPGAIIKQEQGAVIQQQQGAVIQQQQGGVIQQQNSAPAGQASEPPIILEPRREGTTTSVVPSFGDAKQPLEPNPTSSTIAPRTDASGSSVLDNLAPPAEAPQVIMEKPPVGNLEGSSKPPGTSIDSSVRKPDAGATEEPRLEVIPPGKTPETKDSAAPAGSSGKEPAAAKTSAWRTQRPEGSSSRITYQASARKSVGSGKPGDPLGVID